MDDLAIKIESVSKTFKLPHEKQGSVKGLFVSLFRGNRTFERQKVLDNVSFEIKKGNFFGIVGRNGSGKSTLLKLLAGIYAPDTGAISVNGKLTPFIELGVGFNPELTGRENVFLNGALLGFGRKEMNLMYQDIVDFAEIEKFMDQKLKNYSSGMQVRLAFSIAIRAKSDILVLDEVLAVGDEAFQKKCNSVFAEYKKSNRTVVLVSHDMQAIKKYCERVAVIDNGKLLGIYTPSEAAAVYQEINASSYGDETVQSEKKVRRWGDSKVKVDSLEFYSNGKPLKKKRVTSGEELEVKISFKSEEKQKIILGLMFEDSEGVNLSGPNSINYELQTDQTASYVIPRVPFLEGEYKLTVAVFSKDMTQEHDHIYNGFKFTVVAANTTTNPASKVELFGTWDKSGIS